MKKQKTDGPNVNKKAIFVIAGIGFCVLVLGNFTGSNEDSPSVTPQVPKAIEAPQDGINQLTAIDKDAALTQVNKQIEVLKDQNARAEAARIKSDKENEARIREVQQSANAQARALSEQISQLQQKTIDDIYSAMNQKDKTGTTLKEVAGVPSVPLATGGLSFDGDFDLGASALPTAPAAKSNPYGPNYRVLRPQGVEQAQAQYKGRSGGGAGSDEQALFNDMSAPSASDQPSYINGGYTGQAQNTAPTQQPVMTAEQAAAKKRQDDTYEIPAFSFVEVTLLHGVACPVGANSPGASDANKIPARPVVVPIRGIFHGPNNVERDLGTAHLMGLCSGRRTSSSTTGRATIRVEQLSYWDASGGSQMVAATGYIVDDRDNEQDVYGKLDKASGRVLAQQSAAAAAAAFATTLSASEFTNTSSVQNGTSSATSQLTGDATKAATAQGIAALFQKIGDRFDAEANAAVDTVLVEPGIRLRFITELPIKVVKPLEPFDIDDSMYDVLI